MHRWSGKRCRFPNLLFRLLTMEQLLCRIHPLECLIELGFHLLKLFLGSHRPEQMIVTLTLTGMQLIGEILNAMLISSIDGIRISQIMMQHFLCATLIIKLTLQPITMLPHRIQLLIEPLIGSLKALNLFLDTPLLMLKLCNALTKLTS